MIWKPVVFSAALLALVACESTSFTAKPVEPSRPCPPLTTYSCTDQSRAAAEIKALPADAVLPRFMDDYGRMRKQCGTPPACVP